MLPKLEAEGRIFHETLQYCFVSAICYHIEQGLCHVSLLEVSQGLLLLAIFELRSASCVYIVISVLPHLSMYICEYKIPMGYVSEETNHISVGGKSAGYR